jgi:hypothetical protein
VEFIYLFIYGLFNDTNSISECNMSGEWMIVNDEFEMMWKEAVMAWFKILSHHSPTDWVKPQKPQSGYSVPRNIHDEGGKDWY